MSRGLSELSCYFSNSGSLYVRCKGEMGYDRCPGHIVAHICNSSEDERLFLSDYLLALLHP